MALQAALAGAVGILLVVAGWPASFETTMLLGVALILGLVASFALDAPDPR